MANVNAQAAGGAIQRKNARTISELAEQVGAVGFIATVNGEPQPNSYALNDDEFVSFAKPVKAGLQ